MHACAFCRPSPAGPSSCLLNHKKPLLPSLFPPSPPPPSQALVCGAVKLPGFPEGRFEGPAFGSRMQGRPVYGPATFFVSFSYAYR